MKAEPEKLPCLQESTDPESGKKVWRKPVKCGMHCEKCGWNPEVKEKRIAKMLKELDGKRQRK